MLRGFLFLLLLLPASAGKFAGASPAPAWTVIGTVGKWECVQDKGNTIAVSIGLRLRMGDVLHRANSPRTGSITLFDGVGHRTIACDDPASLPGHDDNGCPDNIPVQLEAAPTDTRIDGPLTTLMAGINALFTAQPGTYYKTVSRDYSGLEDGVLISQSGAAVLTPLLSSLSKGSYQLSFAPAHPQAAAEKAVANSKVAWDPEAKGQPVEVQLPPGLYVVSATAASGDPAGEAWVLVVPASQAQAKAEAFQKVKALTDGWREDSPAATIKAMNRAALDLLSEQP